MNREQAIVRVNPKTQLYASEAVARLEEARRINKMKAVCSSHHVAGTYETPRDEVAPERK